jgi:hypothetical protein
VNQILTETSLTEFSSNFGLFFREKESQKESLIKNDAFICDLLSKWEVTSSLESNQFLVKIKRFAIPLTKCLANLKLKKLLFYQFVDDIIAESIPVTEAEAIQYSAMWLKFSPSTTPNVKVDLATMCIPASMVPLKPQNEWVQKIMSAHQEFVNKSKEEVMDAFFAKMTKWHHFGTFLFKAKVIL